jgi:hypothetical protein
MMTQARLNSVTSKQAIDRIKDSIMINRYFEEKGMRLPSANKMLDYINAVSSESYWNSPD